MTDDSAAPVFAQHLVAIGFRDVRHDPSLSEARPRTRPGRRRGSRVARGGIRAVLLAGLAARPACWVDLLELVHQPGQVPGPDGGLIRPGRDLAEGDDGPPPVLPCRRPGLPLPALC